MRTLLYFKELMTRNRADFELSEKNKSGLNKALSLVILGYRAGLSEMSSGDELKAFKNELTCLMLIQSVDEILEELFSEDFSRN